MTFYQICASFANNLVNIMQLLVFINATRYLPFYEDVT